MDSNERIKLRAFMDDLLSDRDDTAGFSDSDSFFASGRLDSLAAVQLVAFLEQEFKIDFTNIDFEIERMDSIDLLATLCDEVG
jgi:acyl carrier protein